jgi:hypothetical protein
VKNITILKKIVDSVRNMYDILKVLRLWMIFEMANNLEIHIIYCMAFVEMIILRLRLKATYLSTSRSMDESEPTICRPVIGFTSIEASACCSASSDALASPSRLGGLIIGRFSEFSRFIKSQFYSPTSVQNVFITKLFELWIICKGVCSIANFCQVGRRYAVFLINIYGNITTEQKNIAILQKSC